MFRIKTGNTDQHRVEARSESEAVRKWLSESGYDSVRQAAQECFCEPREIRAVKMIRLG